MKKQRSTEENILRLAYRAINEVECCRSTLDDLLDAPEYLPLRRTLSHLLTGYFKYKKAIDAALAKYFIRTPDKETHALLKAALAQAVLQHNSAPESVVNVAVECGKKLHTHGFVNAVLRRALADMKTSSLPSDAENILPDNLLARWKKQFSETETEQFSAAFVAIPDFTFRLEHKIKELSFEWKECYSPSEEFPFGTAMAHDVLNSQEFLTGKLYIQDPAASFAVSLAPAEKVSNILDLCAAPGGKSLMLIEKYPQTEKFTAFDRSSRRQELTRKNFELRNIQFPVISDRKLLGVNYDLILLDAPCSNSGVFRRRPDALWRFSQEEMMKNVAIQSELLDEAASRVISGGYIIYSTCSIDQEEDELQIESFLLRHKQFKLVKSGKLLPTLQHDGAFAALLKKEE